MTDSKNYTHALAEFCANLSFDKLPEDVVHKARLCVLDYVANIYGSLELKTVNDIVDYFRSQSTGGSTTVLGCGFKTNQLHAVFINGTTAEAIEAQDGYRYGGNHPGVAVIPAAIAAAEEQHLGGKEIIEAVVAGYEAANRPAAAMHPWHTLSGFLPTGTCGAFGAAAAAARIYKFDTSKMLNAIGNAGYLLPLSMAEHLMGGFSIKIVQGGQAASAGILAAGFSGKGLTGSDQVLEGSSLNGGFTQITTKVAPKMEKITEALGEKYSILDVYFKPYTACRHTHGAAQAALELVKEHDISWQLIEKVKVFTYGIAELAVGKGRKKNDSFISAQFSIPHVVASCLMDGELGPLQLTEKRISDEELISLSEKISVSIDETLNKMYPDKTASRVEIFLKDNRVLTRQIDIPKGDPRDPMEVEDIIRKLKKYAGDRDSGLIDRIIEKTINLEKIKDIRDITSLI